MREIILSSTHPHDGNELSYDIFLLFCTLISAILHLDPLHSYAPSEIRLRIHWLPWGPSRVISLWIVSQTNVFSPSAYLVQAPWCLMFVDAYYSIFGFTASHSRHLCLLGTLGDGAFFCVVSTCTLGEYAPCGFLITFNLVIRFFYCWSFWTSQGWFGLRGGWMLHDFLYAAPFEPLGTDLSFLEFGFCRMVIFWLRA